MYWATPSPPLSSLRGVTLFTGRGLLQCWVRFTIFTQMTLHQSVCPKTEEVDASYELESKLIEQEIGRNYPNTNECERGSNSS